MLLAALRGSDAAAVPLIEATIGAAAAAGQGIGVSYGHWAAAILYNGSGRYAEALDAAGQASEESPGLYVSMWALPELVEAAVRAGRTETAADALRQLAQTTQAGGTDLGLGIEARCRALLSDGAGAEACYREATGRLSRTRIRPELARAHLLYPIERHSPGCSGGCHSRGRCPRVASRRECAASRSRTSATASSGVPSGTRVVMVTRYSTGDASVFRAADGAVKVRAS